MNILFICSRNIWRSLTAEHIFNKIPGIRVRSAGTSLIARVRVKARDIEWADLIFVMEKKHQDILKLKFAQELSSKQVICLNIPDIYPYMDEELVELLRHGVSGYLYAEVMPRLDSNQD